jgi:hypothetical protein
MNTPRLPAMAAVHLRGALDSLEMADKCLGIALDALQGVELEFQPAAVDSFDVIAMRETVRLFASLFAGVADGVRLPTCSAVVQKMITERDEDPRNPAGLERAALAIGFASASLGDVLDAIDEHGDGEGDELYNRVLAAQDVLGMIQVRIESAIVGGRSRSPRFGLFGLN